MTVKNYTATYRYIGTEGKEARTRLRSVSVTEADELALGRDKVIAMIVAVADCGTNEVAPLVKIEDVIAD